jgi:hypothetical protein
MGKWMMTGLKIWSLCTQTHTNAFTLTAFSILDGGRESMMRALGVARLNFFTKVMAYALAAMTATAQGSMPFEIKKATRQSTRPLISLYGESGNGKTYSALLLARGFVGPEGKIVLADTESGRGSLYADVLPGGYDTIDIEPPFTPERAVEVIDTVEKSGATIGCLDSGSHFWEGVGGVLDQASANEERSGKPGLHNWKNPKFSHAKFMLRLLRSSIPWVICLRAKHKSRQTKDDRGKTVIIKDDHASPIQAEDFLFEMTAHAEVLPDHSIFLSKCSHPSLRECFPKQGPITIETGELIAKWCKGNGPAPKTETNGPSAELKKLKQKLWNETRKLHGGDQAKLEDWLHTVGILGENEKLSEMPITRYADITAKAIAAQKK